MAGAVILLEELRAKDVARHQVGRELDTAEAEIERRPKRPHEERLAESRNPFEQAVAAREQADQQLLDNIVLSDNGDGNRAP